MTDPLVSIVIPVYNGANYLRQAIDSALAQTYQNIEVLVVNDGSRDGGASEAIALSYGDRIRYFHKENGGVATALNLGITQMAGEYFSWLSHDDLYEPHKTQTEIETLRRHGDMTALVYSNISTMSAGGDDLYSPSRLGYPHALLTDSVGPVLKGFINGCALLIHKSHFARVGVFDERLKTIQDYDLWFRMFRGMRHVYIDTPQAAMRVHDSRGTVLMKNQFIAEHAERHLAFLDSLSQEEKEAVFGSVYRCYAIVCERLLGFGSFDAYRQVSQLLQNEPMPPRAKGWLAELEAYIAALSGGKATKLCIFGAGGFGLRLYYNLRGRLIPVDCFCDNNPAKQGTVFNALPCLSFEALEADKAQTLVVVATQTPLGIMAQLEKAGFPHVTTLQEITPVLERYTPVKQMLAHDITGQTAPESPAHRARLYAACMQQERDL